MEVNPRESHNVWGEYFEKFQKRGVHEVDLLVVAGLPSLSATARFYFSGLAFQRCVVHKQRNVLNKERPLLLASLKEKIWGEESWGKLKLP